MYDVTDYTLEDLLCLLDAEREQAEMFRRIASNVPSSRHHARDLEQAGRSELLAALCEAELIRRGYDSEESIARALDNASEGGKLATRLRAEWLAKGEHGV